MRHKKSINKSQKEKKMVKRLTCVESNAVCQVSKKSNKPYSAIFATWRDDEGNFIKTVTFLRPWEAAALGLEPDTADQD